ncbi:MAG: thioredoxin-disulfide reductase [Candidatus Sumerlaeaceae bacterium]|nr:thioredoxin-disulfide reductase [Candidatus Sumerlaeaceae bacterium]
MTANTPETHPEEKSSIPRDQVHRVIIIGSGPGGLTAALYNARANLKPLVFEGDGFEQTMPGGQLMITTEIENYPGMVHWKDGQLHGMQGPEMMDILRRQAQHFGADCRQQRVTKVDFSKRPLVVEVDDEKHYAESVIIATGASAKWLDIPTEADYKSYGVSACATCDGAFFKEKHVLVVGGGDTAMEEANYLTKHAAKVTIVHRREEFRASKIMLDRCRNNPKIAWELNAVITEVVGKTEGMRKFVTGAKLKDTKTGAIRDVACDGIFVAIGHQPNTDLFKGIITMDETGYLVTEPRSTYTNVRGVFACGDAQDHVYRQAVTAAGTGCMAAIDAERFIESNPITFA